MSGVTVGIGGGLSLGLGAGISLGFGGGLNIGLTGGVVVLDSMVFTGFEVPERIGFGTQQRINMHRLPGGGRVIDAMGEDPAPITWSGIFLGAGHQSRRAQLDAIRAAGEPVMLAWGDHVLTVMLVDCQYDESHQQTRYRVACEVLPEPRSDDDDDWADGDGEPPSTPAAARVAGQRMSVQARISAVQISALALARFPKSLNLGALARPSVQVF